jgi:hypothetical protein
VQQTVKNEGSMKASAMTASHTPLVMDFESQTSNRGKFPGGGGGVKVGKV